MRRDVYVREIHVFIEICRPGLMVAFSLVIAIYMISELDNRVILHEYHIIS